MKILFYNPSRACLVIEYSMLPKIGAISYLGNWDFSKVYIAQKFDSEEKDIIIEHLKKLGRGDEPLQKFYQEAFLITTKNLDDWLSKRLQFSSALASGHEKEGTVFFDNGFAYNIEKRIIRSNTGVVPRSLFVLIGDDFTEMVYPNANSPFSALVIKEETEEDEEGKKQVRYKCILLDRELATSMLARLYFFNGKGLKHFASFIDSEEGNNYIRVFNIIW